MRRFRQRRREELAIRLLLALFGTVVTCSAAGLGHAVEGRRYVARPRGSVVRECDRLERPTGGRPVGALDAELEEGRKPKRE